MAFYENAKLVRETDKPEQYQRVRKIGEEPGGPGIYRCQSCGFEDVMNRECTKLPPCSNCSKQKGANTWKFLVIATDAA
ncbi:hypothetical protein [Pseudomonas helleri]|uniref:hypothetical protein n=1 Tax=Pseudomonas helleri TaxID=1608996 RepID=UPI002430A23F|nr:hypothetical protein [Pseudomonas helleri]